MVKMKMGNLCHSWTSANGHVPLQHGHNFGLVNSTLFCERFEPRSHFKSRLSLIIRVNIFLNRAVFVDSDWHFDNLCGSHLQSQKRQSLSTKTVLFRTTFTQTIKLNLILSTLVIESCYNLFTTHTATSKITCPSWPLKSEWMMYKMMYQTVPKSLWLILLP